MISFNEFRIEYCTSTSASSLFMGILLNDDYQLFFLRVSLGVSICKTTQVGYTIFQFSILFPPKWGQEGNAICFFIILCMASSHTHQSSEKKNFFYVWIEK